MHSSEYR
ncbi:hypothetical protein D049_2970A, partial [Vibrio parahaemolyticus VPTS-2010]